MTTPSPLPWIGDTVWFTEEPSARAGTGTNRPCAAIVTNHGDGDQLELWVLNSLHPRFLLAPHDPTGQLPGTWRARLAPSDGHSP